MNWNWALTLGKIGSKEEEKKTTTMHVKHTRDGHFLNIFIKVIKIIKRRKQVNKCGERLHLKYFLKYMCLALK